jgi:hypothetical protein
MSCNVYPRRTKTSFTYQRKPEITIFQDSVPTQTFQQQIQIFDSGTGEILSTPWGAQSTGGHMNQYPSLDWADTPQLAEDQQEAGSYPAVFIGLCTVGGGGVTQRLYIFCLILKIML